MSIAVEVSTIGGGLLCFLTAFCSGIVCSTVVVSVSMSLILKGAKELRINTLLEAS
jgi:hypothetical protein